MKRQESSENYLETILVLTQRLGCAAVRSIDIASEMGFTKPSVSVAMKHLREKGLITMGADGAIKLTQSGTKVATCVYERHTVLTEMLLAIGVSDAVAKEDACRVEHDISDETFACIKAQLARKQPFPTT
ncbi:MAG: metal-dependent transcriptional regulator [Ruthenibacterium sp.]